MQASTAASAVETTNPKREQFLVALSALVAQFDLIDLMTADNAASPMRLHKGATAANFSPATHASAPQFAPVSITDSNPGLVTIAGEQYSPHRVQISLNYFHLVPASYVEPASAAKVATATKANRVALTAEQIKAARGSLAATTGLKVVNPTK